MKTLNPYINFVGKCREAMAFYDEKEQQRIFDTLADGGKVDYPLHDTFWGARFGMVTDRYGIHWQLNCEKKPA